MSSIENYDIPFIEKNVKETSNTWNSSKIIINNNNNSDILSSDSNNNCFDKVANQCEIINNLSDNID